MKGIPKVALMEFPSYTEQHSFCCSFRQEVDNGILEVIQPPAKWYPNLNELPSKWGDSEERSK